jgi:hypothetical protein
MIFHENGTVGLRKGIVTEILSTEQDMRVSSSGVLEFILGGVMVTVSVVTIESQW